jgi:hypothetical protein
VTEHHGTPAERQNMGKQAGKPQNGAGVRCSGKDQDPRFCQGHRHRLEDLAAIVKQSFPHRETVNKYHRILEAKLPLAFGKKDIALFHRLLKSITLLHQKQRREDRFGRFYTEKEDIYITLFLMERQLETKRPEYLLSRPERWFYSLLLSEFGHESFTRREAQQLSNLSKTNTHWKLWELMTKGLLERNGSKGKGYDYRILES